MIFLSIQFVDHPLIAVGQALVAVALLRLFFIVRKDGAPLPQIMLGLSVSVWVNLTARITSADWFYIADIAQYWIWLAVIVASIVQRRHRQKQTANQKSPVVIPDFFDRWQNQITWAGGLAVAGMLFYGYLSAYQKKQDAEKNADRATLRENTRVNAEYARLQAEADARDKAVQDSLLRGLDSLKQADKIIVGNQYQVMSQNATLAAKVDHKSALTRKTIRDAVGKLPLQTITPKEPQPEDKPKNLYEKFKDFFRHKDHSRAIPSDSLGHAYYRTDYWSPGDSTRLPE